MRSTIATFGFRPRLALMVIVSEMVAAALVTVIWLLVAGRFGLWPLLLAAAALGMGSLAVLIVLADGEARRTARADRERPLQGLEAPPNPRLIPICATCKKIRDDEGSWHQVEDYLHRHSVAEFTHGICPDCVKRLYASGVLEENNHRRPPDRTPPDK